MRFYNTISIAALREYLRYDYETGNLYWIKSPNNGVSKGSIAGTVDSRTGVKFFRLKGNNYFAHRVVWALHYGEWPEIQIDHKDLNPGNNRIDNLRLSTQSQNMANKRKQRNNSLGIKGVHYSGRLNKYLAQIKCGDKSYHLGCFDTKEEAAEAYRLKALALFGDFARVE